MALTQRSYSDAVDAAIGGATLSDAEKRNMLGNRNVHKAIPIDHERVLDRFAKAKPRRFLLKDPTAPEVA